MELDGPYVLRLRNFIGGRNSFLFNGADRSDRSPRTLVVGGTGLEVGVDGMGEGCFSIGMRRSAGRDKGAREGVWVEFHQMRGEEFQPTRGTWRGRRGRRVQEWQET
eukprot:2762124-Rhodomonas_salina.1